MKRKKNSTPVTMERGRIYFSRKTERSIFFVMTLVMLGIGIGYRAGLW